MPEATLFIEYCLARLKTGDLRARDELVTRVSAPLMVLSDCMLRKSPAVGRWQQADDLFPPATMRLHSNSRYPSLTHVANKPDELQSARLRLPRLMRDSVGDWL